MHSFTSYRTGQYKLHYFETATNIKFVMLTDTQTPNMRSVLHQIYVNLYVEFGKVHRLVLGVWAKIVLSRQESSFSSRASWRRGCCKRIIRVSIGPVRERCLIIHAHFESEHRTAFVVRITGALEACLGRSCDKVRWVFKLCITVDWVPHFNPSIVSVRKILGLKHPGFAAGAP